MPVLGGPLAEVLELAEQRLGRDEVLLGEDEDWLRMSLYLAGSMLVGLAATGLGWVCGGALA